MGNLFARKPLDRLMHEAQEVGEHSLKRSLGWINLVALGIGGIIGAGLFIRTAVRINKPAPMIPPIPSATRFIQPSERFRLCSPTSWASCISLSRGFLANRFPI